MLPMLIHSIRFLTINIVILRYAAKPYASLLVRTRKYREYASPKMRLGPSGHLQHHIRSSVTLYNRLPNYRKSRFHKAYSSTNESGFVLCVVRYVAMGTIAGMSLGMGQHNYAVIINLKGDGHRFLFLKTPMLAAVT